MPRYNHVYNNNGINKAFYGLPRGPAMAVKVRARGGTLPSCVVGFNGTGWQTVLLQTYTGCHSRYVDQAAASVWAPQSRDN